MKKMTNNDIQNVCLELTKEFHRFCTKNHLRYTLAYGTLIGAIRHKGFIPWDNDVDIIMPRPDYNKFVELYQDNENYSVIAPEKGNSLLAYGRLVENKRTLIVTLTHWANKDTGIWIDIFPFDGVEDDEFSFNKFWLN